MQQITSRRRGITVVLLTLLPAAALGLAACGGDDTSGAAGGMNHGASTLAKEMRGPDVAFVQGMIPHHQQAVAMADVALDPRAGAGANVKDLAARIKKAQDPEIALMKGWLSKWGVTDAGGGQMMGMATDTDLTLLAEATGQEFDAMWLKMMIAHHEGAIEMAKNVRSGGSDADIKMLAGQVISAQQAEITEMTGILGA